VETRPSPSREEIAEIAAALSAAVEARDFGGRDPYDALSSPALQRVALGSLGRRAAIQLLKGSPLDPRTLLGVPVVQHAKAVALFTSAYARLAALDGGGDYRELASRLAGRLIEQAIPAGSGVGWGYDFDVQTRWGYYRAGTPNAVVTAFAAHALMDVQALGGRNEFTPRVAAALDFARSDLLVENGEEQFFAYYAGSRVPIHNANLLVGSLFARSGAQGSEAARDFSLARQRPDGSWPYGEGAGLAWVDGYHTAFILWSLNWWKQGSTGAPVEEPLRRGLNLYLGRLIDADGAARASLSSRYPVDIHALASAVWSLSELSLEDKRALGVAEQVLNWTLSHMRRPDGRFAFQQRRFFRNSIPYVRWGDAHMMLALASYLRTVSELRA
jgi:hypothetical protein